MPLLVLRCLVMVLTLLLRMCVQMDIFDAAQKYMSTKTPVIILAGKEYGSGSSRDWAAKGPWMLVSRCYIETN